MTIRTVSVELSLCGLGSSARAELAERSDELLSAFRDAGAYPAGSFFDLVFLESDLAAKTNLCAASASTAVGGEETGAKRRLAGASAEPTSSPTVSPTVSPTSSPTSSPTARPSDTPSAMPVGAAVSPADAPTKAPTEIATHAPTRVPTKIPTDSPSLSNVHAVTFVITVSLDAASDVSSSAVATVISDSVSSGSLAKSIDRSGALPEGVAPTSLAASAPVAAERNVWSPARGGDAAPVADDSVYASSALWGVGAALIGALLIGVAAATAFVAAAVIYRVRHRKKHFDERHNDVGAFLAAVECIDDPSMHSALTRRRVPFSSGDSKHPGFHPSGGRLRQAAGVEMVVVAGATVPEDGGSDSGIEFGA